MQTNLRLEIIPISVYCEIVGCSVYAINKRVNEGIWVQGIHVLKLDGIKERQVDLTAIEAWMRNPANQID